MKIILNTVFVLLLFSCGDKQTTNLETKGKSTVAQSDKATILPQKTPSSDSTTSLETPAPIPVKVPQKIEDKPIACFPPKIVECKDKGGDMENGFVTECTYRNQNLDEAYNAFRERNKANDEGKYLEKKMPTGKHIAGFSDYPISVTYSYPKQNILEIEILFPGGVTTIIFKTEKDDVIVTTNNSPD